MTDRQISKLLEGKVAVITGAGNGIGRATALEFAALGARVVVNDLGAGISGKESDPTVAQIVTDEITASGGEAIANTGSVAEPETADEIIRLAIENFGRIDIVVNNAGNVRFSPFDQMAFEDFDSLIKVHLYGSFLVARAAAPYFRDQRSGSYIHMSSAAGLVGNRGNANYSSAKLGIAALSKSIAFDMQEYGVRSNCIAPSAYSRMTDAVDAQRRAKFTQNAAIVPLRNRQGKVEQVVPLVTYLASDLSTGVTGQIFGVRGSEIYLYSQPRPIRTLHRDGGWSPETLVDMEKSWRSSFVPLETYQDVFSWDPVH